MFFFTAEFAEGTEFFYFRPQLNKNKIRTTKISLGRQTHTDTRGQTDVRDKRAGRSKMKVEDPPFFWRAQG